MIVEFLRYAGEITMGSSALIGFHPAKQATGLSFTLLVRKGHHRCAWGPASSHFRSFDISTAMAASCSAEMPFFIFIVRFIRSTGNVPQQDEFQQFYHILTISFFIPPATVFDHIGPAVFRGIPRDSHQQSHETVTEPVHEPQWSGLMVPVLL